MPGQAAHPGLGRMRRIKDADYDLHTKNAPAGTAEAMGKITNYQITRCGISYG